MICSIDVYWVPEEQSYTVFFDGKVMGNITEDIIEMPGTNAKDLEMQQHQKLMTFDLAKGSEVMLLDIQKRKDKYPVAGVTFRHPLSRPDLMLPQVVTHIPAKNIFVSKLIIRGIRYYKSFDDKNPKIVFDGAEKGDYFYQLGRITTGFDGEEIYNYIIKNATTGNLKNVGQ